MKPLTHNEIMDLRYAKQYFQDCYLVSSIGALANSKKGSKILENNIVHTNDGFRVKFNNINNKSEDFFVTQKELDDLIPLDKYGNPTEINKHFPQNPIIKAIEIAMNKIIDKHPSKKPWLSRIPSCNEKFEFNKPSNFLEMFTGEKPIKLNEDSFKLSLKSKKKEAIEIFDQMSDNPDSSFVVGTSINLREKDLNDFHCFDVKNVNKTKETIELFDHRFQEITKLTYNEAIKQLKYIVGYFGKEK